MPATADTSLAGLLECLLRHHSHIYVPQYRHSLAPEA